MVRLTVEQSSFSPPQAAIVVSPESFGIREDIGGEQKWIGSVETKDSVGKPDTTFIQ